MIRAWGLVIAAVCLGTLSASGSASARPQTIAPVLAPSAAAEANPIERENQRRGLRLGKIPSASGRTIEGYTSQTSYAAGETLRLHVSTVPAARFQVRVYRLGFYKGLGARFMACLPSCRQAQQGVPQPQDAPDPTTGLVREQWPVTNLFRIPRGWATGYYVLQLLLKSGNETGRVSWVPLVVRTSRTARPSHALVISAVNTTAAYNRWGGKSLYTFNSTGNVAANHVSFDRPGAGGVSAFDLPLVRLFEQQGFDVAYETDVDVQRDPGELLRHRAVLVLGHAEYWSRQMRDAFENARDDGVNLGFLGGNIGDWQIRYEDSERTVVGYKAVPDPTSDPRDATTKFASLHPPRPQCQLIGTQFAGGQGAIKRYGVNAAALSDPWLRNTGFKAGDTFSGNGLEYDVAAPAGCVGYPVTTFFSDASRPNIAPAVRYVAASGAKVFGAGSFALTAAIGDARVRRFAVNAIADLSR